MQQGTTHIIGAGLAGLSAATQLAGQGRAVIVYEAAGQAGGRCRSYYDPAFGAVIDNGNHLLLSGNDAAFSYLRRIGSESAFVQAANPVFDFADATTRKRWTLRLGAGRTPFWLLDKNRRVPDTKVTEYFSVLRLLLATRQQTIAPLLNKNTVLYRRLWHPLLLSALNTHPEQASATLAGAVLRGTLLKGGNACIPWVAEKLSASFIDPALAYLAANHANILFNRRVREIHKENNRATALAFTTGEPVPLAPSDTVISAVPPWAAAPLLPGTEAPDEHRAILNAHFRITPFAGFPKIMGVVNGLIEWIFSFPDRVSVTISDADRLMQEDREVLAVRIWQEVAAITGLANSLPPWQIVKEKRATFAATPAQDAKRPGTRTAWENIYLAGDWVQNGLPATIEGAVRSGARAAELSVRQL